MVVSRAKKHSCAWEYYVFKIADHTLAHASRGIGYSITRFITDIVYVTAPVSRAAIKDNVKHVLGPEVDDATLERTMRTILRNAGKNYYDLIRIPHLKLSDIESSIRVHSWTNLEDAMGNGKGVLLVTAHLGCFDVAAQILPARSIKTTIMVEPLEPTSLLNYIVALRESQGITCIPAAPGALKNVVQTLRRGEVVIFACDRDFAKDGVKIDFFGEETNMPTTAVRIAMLTGSAIVPVFNIRQDDGHYDIYFEPAIDIVPTGGGAVAKNMERITQVMEKYIRNYPEQWVVLKHIWTGGQQLSTHPTNR